MACPLGTGEAQQSVHTDAATKARPAAAAGLGQRSCTERVR